MAGLGTRHVIPARVRKGTAEEKTEPIRAINQHNTIVNARTMVEISGVPRELDLHIFIPTRSLTEEGDGVLNTKTVA